MNFFTQFPPSLATAFGTQRCSGKSVLTRILENVPKNIDEYDDEHSELNIEINTVFNSTYDCIVYDGPSLVGTYTSTSWKQYVCRI